MKKKSARKFSGRFCYVSVKSETSPAFIGGGFPSLFPVMVQSTTGTLWPLIEKIDGLIASDDWQTAGMLQSLPKAFFLFPAPGRRRGFRRA